MTRFSVLLCLALSTFLSLSAPASDAHAQDENFGLGIILGDPNGVSMKGMLNSGMAIDGAVGFSVLEGDYLHAHVDFLWQTGLSEFDRAFMLLHYGVGPKLAAFDGNDGPGGDGDGIWIGARAPVGLTFVFRRVPMDLFMEVAAGLWIIEDTDFDIDAAIGTRYWF